MRVIFFASSKGVRRALSAACEALCPAREGLSRERGLSPCVRRSSPSRPSPRRGAVTSGLFRCSHNKITTRYDAAYRVYFICIGDVKHMSKIFENILLIRLTSPHRICGIFICCAPLTLPCRRIKTPAFLFGWAAHQNYRICGIFFALMPEISLAAMRQASGTCGAYLRLTLRKYAPYKFRASSSKNLAAAAPFGALLGL